MRYRQLRSVEVHVIRWFVFFFFFQAEDGIRDYKVTGVQTCALPICRTWLAYCVKPRCRLSPGKRSGGTSHAPAAAARSSKRAAAPDGRIPRPAPVTLISVPFAHILPVPPNSI